MTQWKPHSSGAVFLTLVVEVSGAVVRRPHRRAPPYTTQCSSGQQLNRRRQRDALCPFRQTLVERHECRCARTARQMKRVRKIKAFIGYIERRQNYVAVLKHDVLEASERAKYVGSVFARQFVDATHQPLEFQQHSHRNDRSFGERRERASSDAGSKSFSRRGAPRAGALTMPAIPVMWTVATDRTTRSFSPSETAAIAWHHGGHIGGVRPRHL